MMLHTHRITVSNELCKKNRIANFLMFSVM